MTEYARVDANLLVSRNSDYSTPYSSPTIAGYATNPGEVLTGRLGLSTSEQTFSLSSFTTPTALLVYNVGSTTAWCRYRTQKATKTFAANKLGFTATAPVTITDDDSTFLSSLFFRAGDYAVVTGASEAGNIQTSLVQIAVAGTLTLIESATQTLDADDAGTPTIVCLSEGEISIPAGGTQIIHACYPSYGLVLYTQSSTTTVEVYALGS